MLETVFLHFCPCCKCLTSYPLPLLYQNVKEAEEILKQKNCFEEVERIRREFEDKKKTK